jgi:HprK-related kinase A
VHLRSDFAGLAAVMQPLYVDYAVALAQPFADIHVQLRKQRNLRRWLKPEARVWVGDPDRALRFPRDLAFPFMEWGINWCVATRAYQYLLLHTGVVEKQGKAILLPASPASGKSTLCAALSERGWRLLSDEFGLVRPSDLALIPFPRPIPLKNESIEIIRARLPDAVLGPEYDKTRKGTIRHLRPPADSIARAHEPARAAWVVSPQFIAGAETRLLPMSKAHTFIKLSHNSFNYDKLGLRSFQTVAGLVENCAGYTLTFGDLDQAVAELEALTSGQLQPSPMVNEVYYAR